MSGTVKFIAAWQDGTGRRFTLTGNGTSSVYAKFDAHLADQWLAVAGQRAIWPEGHGVAPIEDIPRPEPLPTVYVRRETAGVFASVVMTRSDDVIATITFDADDNATVVRHGADQ